MAGGLILRLPPLAWGLVALTIALVLAVELLNTAIEAVVDLVSPQDHPLAKRAKDVAAAAVFTTALGAVAVAVCLGIWLAGRR